MTLRDIIRINAKFGDPINGDVDLAIYNGNAFYGYYGYGRGVYGADKSKLASILKKKEADNPQQLTYYWNKIKADQIHNQSIANLCVYTTLLIGSESDYIKNIQGVLGAKKDGNVGQKTLYAINAVNQQDLFDRLVEEWKSYHNGMIEKEEDQKKKELLNERMNKLEDFKFEAGKEIKSLIKHRGFDYKAIIGDEVIAVGDGHVVRVRFGHPYGQCKHRKCIQNNTFNSGSCIPTTKCNYTSGCYGVQVWLKLDGQSDLYAYYAHLYKLDQEILDQVLAKVNADPKIGNTIDIDFELKKGKPIGKSGRTGIAYDEQWPPHLHFECRKASNIERADHVSQISPNNIVKTQFIVMQGQKPVFEKRLETTKWSNIDGILLGEWEKLFRNIGRIEKYNYSEKAIYSSPKKPQLFNINPCNEIIDVNRYEVVSSIGTQSIEPYQIVKKSTESYRTGREMTCVYESEEDAIE